jgi:hypothetical protein
MKKTNTTIAKQLMLLMAALFISGSLLSQSTTITDVSSHSADASAVLDVHSTSLGMLMPRLSTAPASPATGLLYYHSTNNNFNFYNGTAWKTFAINDQLHWAKLISGELTPKISTDFVGIGQPPPSGSLNTWLTINDLNGNHYPQFFIIGGNTSGGDASMRYALAGGEGPHYTHGIFDDPSGSDDNFKICNTFTLTGPGYLDPTTMMEIHDENSLPGIIDFNHQSRTRVSLNSFQLIPSNTWQPIDFDNTDYDEHGEFTLAPSPSPSGGSPTAYFTATEEGYYQVNSRTEFFLGGEVNNLWIMQDTYVSIAIYKGTQTPSSWSMYAQGNNLQIGQTWNPPAPPEEMASFKYNNAPNVSDVVYLKAGEKIAIYAWQSAGPPLDLIPGTAKTYVSIHKIS